MISSFWLSHLWRSDNSAIPNKYASGSSENGTFWYHVHGFPSLALFDVARLLLWCRKLIGELNQFAISRDFAIKKSRSSPFRAKTRGKSSTQGVALGFDIEPLRGKDSETAQHQKARARGDHQDHSRAPHFHRNPKRKRENFRCDQVMLIAHPKAGSQNGICPASPA